jgi:hypothetical protein
LANFRGVREVVLVSSEGTALAYRTRDMLDPDSPLHITDTRLSRRTGTPEQAAMNAPGQPASQGREQSGE